MICCARWPAAPAPCCAATICWAGPAWMSFLSRCPPAAPPTPWSLAERLRLEVFCCALPRGRRSHSPLRMLWHRHQPRPLAGRGPARGREGSRMGQGRRTRVHSVLRQPTVTCAVPGHISLLDLRRRTAGLVVEQHRARLTAKRHVLLARTLRDSTHLLSFVGRRNLRAPETPETHRSRCSRPRAVSRTRSPSKVSSPSFASRCNDFHRGLDHCPPKLPLQRGHVHARIHPQPQKPRFLVLPRRREPCCLHMLRPGEIRLQIVGRGRAQHCIIALRSTMQACARTRSIDDASSPTPRYGRRCQ